ncbi:MAG: hypothetical protein V1867_01675 [Candidatus Falkowbacteria bacterium]
MFKKLSMLFALLVLPVIISGCLLKVGPKNTAQSGTDGGVFKSINKGAGWQQRALIPTVSGKPRSFAGVNAASMAMDPSDRLAVYFGTEANGLVYTYDGGASWQTADTLVKGTVADVAVDPKNKCVIYAAVGNRLYKSTDCNRTWNQAYFDNDLMAVVDAVAIDHFDSNNIYIGVSRGDIIKSANAGADWQTVYRAGNRVRKILVDPNDSRNIYVATNVKGVFRSPDAGANWAEMKSLMDTVKEHKLGTDIKDMIITQDESRMIFLATFYGLLRSKDGGETWEKIELIPTQNKAAINALAVNSKSPQEIYYVTNTTFYRSSDSGANWATVKLPTSRAGWKLLLDPEDPNIIYMGVKGLAK